MNRPTLKKKITLLLFMAGLVGATAPVMADKPERGERAEKRDTSRDHGRASDRNEYKSERKSEHKNDRKDEHKDQRYSAGGKRHFEQSQYVMVRDYYGEHYRGRRCPPGLAKKNNGCMPPGQARKWEFGRPLPRDVIYYSVPAPLVVQIGQPPSGHRYVRVAGDILMIAIGTGMVVDAIQDLGGM